MVQYGRAIKILNARLGSEAESTELAVLESILLINIEGFQGYTTLMHVHLRGGLAVSKSLKAHYSDIGYLETALHHIRDQVEEF